MDNERFEQLGKDITRLNEEGFVPEGKELRLFRTADDLIEAIRNNEIPGIPWTEEDEAKWQAAEAIDKAFEVPTEEEELIFGGALIDFEELD